MLCLLTHAPLLGLGVEEVRIQAFWLVQRTQDITDVLDLGQVTYICTSAVCVCVVCSVCGV